MLRDAFDPKGRGGAEHATLAKLALAPKPQGGAWLIACVIVATATFMACSSKDTNPAPNPTLTTSNSGAGAGATTTTNTTTTTTGTNTTSTATGQGGGQGGGSGGGSGQGGSGGSGGNCTGKNGCYNCPPRNTAEFYNHCTDSKCVAFDNKSRLPNFTDDSHLPALP